MADIQVQHENVTGLTSGKRVLLFWVIQITGWITYAIVHLYFVTPARPATMMEAFLKSITFISGFLVSILLWRVYRWLRQKKMSLLLLSINILIYSLLFALIWMALDWILSYPFWSPKVVKEKMQVFGSLTWIPGWCMYYFLLLLPWTLLYFSINFWIDWNEQKKIAERNKELYSEARLIMLRYQLNPHFFFNALNSINALMDEDKAMAKEMIFKLSDFVRYSFLSDNKLLVELEDELKIIRKYFDIEKIRFEEKIQISYDINPDTLKVKIPGFILHPIVENAIKYGMKTSPLPLTINVAAKKTLNGLLLQISNTGYWVGEEIKLNKIMDQKGVGIKNVYSRLENTFGADFEFKVLTVANKVTVNIVLKTL